MIRNSTSIVMKKENSQNESQNPKNQENELLINLEIEQSKKNAFTFNQISEIRSSKNGNEKISRRNSKEESLTFKNTNMNGRKKMNTLDYIEESDVIRKLSNENSTLILPETSKMKEIMKSGIFHEYENEIEMPDIQKQLDDLDQNFKLTKSSKIYIFF